MSGETDFDRPCPGAPKGTVLVDSAYDRLLLDLDSEHAVQQFVRGLGLVDQEYHVRGVRIWESRHGHTHAVVELEKDLDFLERLLIQAALGSDGVRELLSHVRYFEGRGECSVLFKPVRS